MDSQQDNSEDQCSKGRLETLRRLITYRYRLTSWRIVQKWRVLSSWFYRHSGAMRRLGVLMTSTIVAYVLLRLVDVRSLDLADVSGYLFAAGSLIGGIIAIVFSLSVFGEQSAAAVHLSRNLEIYSRGWQEKLIYTVIVILAICFFAVGVWANGAPQGTTSTVKSAIIAGSLAAIAAVFALIDWHYEILRRKTNLLNCLSHLEERATKFLDRTHKDAQRIANIIRAKNQDTSEDMALASAYSTFLRPHLSVLDSQLEHIFEISMKLSSRNEVLAASRGIRSVHRIIAKYLSLRSTSSVRIPSTVVILAVESDSQGFLDRNLERLRSAGEAFIREGNIESAVVVVDVFRSLALASADIRFVSDGPANPIFDQVQGYLRFYIQSAIREKEHEVPFRGASALTELAQAAIRTHLDASVLAIQQELGTIASFGIVSRKTHIVDACHQGWLGIIAACFQHKSHAARQHIAEALKNMKGVTLWMRAVGSGVQGTQDLAISFTLCRPYDDMMETIQNRVVHIYFNKLGAAEDKRWYRSNLLVLFEELWWNIRQLAEDIKICDGVLVDSVARLVWNLNSLMVELLQQDEFLDYRGAIVRQLSRHIHLPSWFTHHSESITMSHALHTLVDTVVKTGLVLLHKGIDNSLVEHTIQASSSMVRATLEKRGEQRSYSEPSLMVRVCYLGVLALKRGEREVFALAKSKIAEFEQLYVQKRFSEDPPPGISWDGGALPKPSHLQLEFDEWRDEFVRESLNSDYRVHIIPDAKGMMFDLVEESDINLFMLEIWGASSTT